MNYRIKETHLSNNEKYFTPQFKLLFFWTDYSNQSSDSITENQTFKTLKEAKDFLKNRVEQDKPVKIIETLFHNLEE